MKREREWEIDKEREKEIDRVRAERGGENDWEKDINTRQ